MNLALVLGEKNGNVVKPKLMNMKDNLNVSCFDDVPQFIDKSMKLGSIYDRIVILPKFIQGRGTLQSLYSFWSNNKDTEIVLLSKKNNDEQIATEFLNTFNTPRAAAMLVESTTVQLIAQSVLLSTNEITDKFGIADFMKIELDDDFVDDSSEDVQSFNNAQNETVSEMPNTVEQQNNNKKEKKGLLSSLFGGKKNKKDKNTQNQQVNNAQPVQQEQPQVVNQQINQQFNQNIPMQNNFEQQNIQEQFNQVDTMNQNVNQFDDSIPDNGFSQQDDMDTMEDFHAEDFGGEDFGEENFDDNEFEKNDDFQETQPTETMNPMVNNSEKPRVDISKPNIDEVDEDFGDFQMEETYNDFSAEPRRKPIIEEVDEDLSDLSISEEAQAYQEINEQPKVIEKTVIKEVIRDKKGGKVSSTVLSGVLDGRYKKIIIVTGDRRTGVTTTALNLAQTFSQSVPVLYFDCDIDNHGLLSYIDYATFRNYERIHMDGVKRCKNSSAFRNCVVQFAHNLDILTTDYSCMASDEDIRDSANVVAENSQDYGVVIVDCPASKLHLIEELLLIGIPVLCVEGNKCGFMNMLCRMDASILPIRYKRIIVGKGTMFLTKIEKGTDVKSLIKYIQSIFEPDGADWMSMRVVKFGGKLSNKILNFVLEG